MEIGLRADGTWRSRPPSALKNAAVTANLIPAYMSARWRERSDYHGRAPPPLSVFVHPSAAGGARRLLSEASPKVHPLGKTLAAVQQHETLENASLVYAFIEK